ncbi:MAG: acyl-CoA desaturase [Burkholderiales bacterium]
MNGCGSAGRRILHAVAAWFDSEAARAEGGRREIDWVRVLPFVALHLACLAVMVTGWSATAVWVAIALYLLRMFAVTAFYHRYFSHRAFRASRTAQFLFALAGASAAQRGPLWWASHHRRHHARADRAGDAHSPHLDGFLWSHMGWFLARASYRTRLEGVPDFARYPELRFLDRYDALVPLLLAATLYGAGEWLAAAWPGLGTNGLQLLVWGFAISTVALYHVTFMVNSIAHRSGGRRFATRDESRNNFWLALLTLGEGWHNNHHHYPGSARQGFYWWELDFTYYGLKVMAACGLISGLRPVPVALCGPRAKSGR